MIQQSPSDSRSQFTTKGNQLLLFRSPLQLSLSLSLSYYNSLHILLQLSLTSTLSLSYYNPLSLSLPLLLQLYLSLPYYNSPPQKEQLQEQNESNVDIEEELRRVLELQEKERQEMQDQVTTLASQFKVPIL